MGKRLRNLSKQQEIATPTESENESKETESKPDKPRISPAQIRAQRDIADFDAIPGLQLVWPDKDDFMRFICYIMPTEGLYKGAKYEWEIVIPTSYPHSPPKCLLKTLPIYHPNIDWEGKPCLNILREDWRPVLSLGSVFQGLLFLYLQPNPYDPLNHGLLLLFMICFNFCRGCR